MSDFKNNAISEFPNIAKVEFKKVNQNYLKVILINFFLVFIPLLVVLSFSINKKLFEETSDYIALIYSIFFVISTVMIIFLIVSFRIFWS